MNKALPLVKPESSGGQHQKYQHRVLSGIIPVYDPFHHHQLILLEWFMDLEQIKILIQMKTLKGERQDYYYKLHDDYIYP